MTHLNKLADQIGAQLGKAEVEYLHALISEWQILADISMGDLVLWVRGGDGRYMAVAHCRPATGITIHLDDVVGLYASPMRSALLEQVCTDDKKEMRSDLRWVGSYAVIETSFPVIYQDRVIAVVTVEVNSQGLREHDEQCHWFNELAVMLCQMILEGNFPDERTVPIGTGHGLPRVSDGVVFLDIQGRVLEATPNARSCFRRIGVRTELMDALLIEEVTKAVQDQINVEETWEVVLSGKASWLAELETDSGIVSMRAVPLRKGKRRVGAILLCRDVTEMRRRERELMTKDATIREIHHRVKNNLQTVSALLRMQARRCTSAEAQAALTEAERRVATIARVHEELSKTADEAVYFDPMILRLMRMSAAMAVTSQPVKVCFKGSFGVIDSETASILSVVISELVTNAVEHGFQEWGGEVTIAAQRDGQTFNVKVADNGSGLKRQPGSGLGTNIVKTLVQGELRGRIEWREIETGGTEVLIQGRLKEEISEDVIRRVMEAQAVKEDRENR